MPNNSKRYFPRITKKTTIRKAVTQDVLAIDFLSCSLLSPTNPKNTGVLAIGFMMAKNPVNTVNAKVKMLSGILKIVY
jgi:hypothetical protein